MIGPYDKKDSEATSREMDQGVQLFFIIIGDKNTSSTQNMVYHTFLCTCVCVCGLLWRSEDNLLKLALSFPYVGPRDQVIGLGSKLLPAEQSHWPS